MHEWGVRIFCILICFFVFASLVEARESDEKDCSLYEAVYKPHISYDVPDKYYIELEVTDPEAEGIPFSRKRFFNFHLKNKESTLLSTLRLAESCTQGVYVCRLNAYWGQYAGHNAELKDIDSKFTLDFTLLNKDFSRYRADADIAPYAIMLNNSFVPFYYELKIMPDVYHMEEADDLPFVRYYSEQKLIPNFSGYDVWIFDRCNIP